MTFTPWLHVPTVGVSFTGVVHVLHGTEKGVVGRLMGSDHPVEIVDDFKYEIDALFTVHHLLTDETDPHVLFATCRTTRVHIPKTMFPPRTVIELCAGVGGIGIGSEPCGFQVLARVDCNALVIEHLLKLGHGLVLQADITHDSTAQLLHAHFPFRVGILTSGFNCQPFSLQGDRREFADERVGSFWGTLRLAYLLQPFGLLLECTPAAGKCHVLRQALDQFVHVMGWKWVELTFDLADQWPNFRCRWWAFCCPVDFASVPLTSWPVDPACQRVCQLIPEWPLWTQLEEQQLMLTPEEREAYFDTFGQLDRMLNLMTACPTFLHSYGNATMACPCGCRATGFAVYRLQKGGLRGFVVCSQSGGLRFLHPREVGFLMGFPGSLPVDTLCLLGQSASPLQSLWMFQHITQVLFAEQHVDPMAAIRLYKTKLLYDQFHAWIVPSLYQDTEVRMSMSDGADLVFSKTGLVSVSQALAALRMQCEPDQYVQLLDGATCVPPEAYLHPHGFHGPYHLLITHGTSAKPASDVLVTFEGLDTFCLLQVPAGSFLFDVLRRLDLSPLAVTVTSRDSVVAPDQRIWVSGQFCIHRHVGAGSMKRAGLSVDFIHLAAQSLLGRVYPSIAVPLFGLLWTSGSWKLMFGSFPSSPFTGVDFGLCCLLMEGHWTLLTWTVLGSFDQRFQVHVEFWDGFAPRKAPPCVLALVDFFMTSWTADCVSCDCPCLFPQQLPYSCGTILLAHLGFFLGALDFAAALDFEALHPHLEHLDFALFPANHMFLNLFGTGKSEGHVSADQTMVYQLATFLREKGVPFDRAEERATLALKKLGLKELEAAFKSPNPWQYLKAIASRPHVSFQWIKADELQAKIRAKANSKFHIQVKPKHSKQAKRGEAQPLWIDPDQLQLVPGTFFAQKHEVSQIAFSDVTPQAGGLAFCAVADALPFLRAGQQLSDKALGLLTTAEIPRDQANGLVVLNLRFPAQYRGTNEPVLILGSLVLLGAIPIARGGDSAKCTLESLPTQTLRLSVFRDQWEGSWDDFMMQLVRAVLSKHPLLTLCKTEGCGDACSKYHAAVDEPLDNLILDLWARSWHKADSRYCKPAESCYWSVLVRVPASAHLTVQGLSGVQGLYVEPRSDCGKQADDRFGMIWLGERSPHDMAHLLKTTPHAIAIGRLRQKYGLRFPRQHLEAGAKVLKPDEPYVDTQIHRLYRLYPLPFGTQRVALQKCLTDWGWSARVRQSIGGGAEGTAWEAGACDEPPKSVLPGPDGDVAITLLRSVSKNNQPPALLASAATKKFLQTAQAAAPSVDPWTLGSDPWISSAPSTAAPRSTDKMQQIEDRLHQHVVQVVQKQVAESVPTGDSWMTGTPIDLEDYKAQTEARFSRLESGMTELHSQNQQVEVQGAKVEQVSRELHTQVGSLQDRIASVQQEVSAGFNRMEALLEKRAKTS